MISLRIRDSSSQTQIIRTKEVDREASLPNPDQFQKHNLILDLNVLAKNPNLVYAKIKIRIPQSREIGTSQCHEQELLLVSKYRPKGSSSPQVNKNR